MTILNPEPCDVCAALVAYPAQHAKWHALMDEAAAAAIRADMMTRPIGPGANAMDSLRRGHNLPALPPEVIEAFAARHADSPAPSPSPGVPE